MTTRLLPVAEWAALAGTELEAVWPLLDPATARIVVVEDDEQIVGCWALFTVIHAEGVYVAPEYRKGGAVARRLLRGARRIIQEAGARTFVTAALTEEVENLAERIGGVRLPGTHFVVSV